MLRDHSLFFFSLLVDDKASPSSIAHVWFVGFFGLVGGKVKDAETFFSVFIASRRMQIQKRLGMRSE